MSALRPWKQAPPRGRSEGRAAEALRRVGPPRPLSAAQLAFIEQRLDRRLGRRRPSQPTWLRYAVAGALAVFAPIAFAAALRVWRAQPEPLLPASPAMSPARSAPAGGDVPVTPPDTTDGLPAPTFEEGLDLSVSPSDTAWASDPREAAPGGPEEPVAPGVLPGVEPPPRSSGERPRFGALSAPGSSAASPARSAAPAPPAAGLPALPVPLLDAPPPPAGTDSRLLALVAESRLLGRAIHQLRQERLPSAALDTLDDYLEQFPRGQLRNEERVQRIDALLALNRKAQALDVLEQLEPDELAQLPRNLELRLLRAELLLDVGRPDDALGAFEGLEHQRLAPALEERRNFGHAAALVAAGAPSGREAVRRYLERYPHGAHATQARHLLEER